MKFSRNTLIVLIMVVLVIVAIGAWQLQAPATPAIRAEAVWSRPAIMAEMDHQVEGMASAETTEGEMEGMQMDVGTRGVIYLILVNEGRSSDRLIGVQTNIAAHAELHQTIMEEDGLMKMRPVEGGVEIPARGQVAFEPGSYHIMLMGLKQGLKGGDRFPLVLQFEKSAPLTVESEVMER